MEPAWGTVIRTQQGLRWSSLSSWWSSFHWNVWQVHTQPQHRILSANVMPMRFFCPSTHVTLLVGRSICWSIMVYYVAVGPNKFLAVTWLDSYPSPAPAETRADHRNSFWRAPAAAHKPLRALFQAIIWMLEACTSASSQQDCDHVWFAHTRLPYQTLPSWSFFQVFGIW